MLFFFKQKTAYEVRISDWSSDVCSSDLPALLALALAGWAATAGAVVLTGEVRATDAQVIYTPFSNSSPVVIRFFVPEGEHVKKGEPVLRIDPGQAASQLPELDAQIEQAQATAAKPRSEERRGGKEVVGTLKSGGAP